jgi:SpoIID/LytB domain protein
LLAQIHKQDALAGEKTSYVSIQETEEAYIRWYDREDHNHFHVCADDHCQRYQGITRATNPEVEAAAAATRGEVISYDGKICDARFSKCCGGVTEKFEYCWEHVEHPYLLRVDDREDALPGQGSDLKREENARAFILAAPDRFCNTRDARLLSQVLNDYDQESPDFYRWTVEYTQEELASLISQRSGLEFGKILNLVPVQRGESGRLVRLRIEGSLKTLVVGKELEIRRWLSPSHLYSSAFVVEKQDVREGIPGRFILRGAGWGHGVGLCQIGAAVMADRNYGYEEIIMHYFRGASIEKYYE